MTPTHKFPHPWERNQSSAVPGVAGEAMLPAGLPRLAMLSGPPGERSDVSDEDSTLPTWKKERVNYVFIYLAI